jgi:hypothetical protein
LVLVRALCFPLATATAAALLFVVSLGVLPFLGAEFLPRLDEGSILVMMYRVPGISIGESLHGNEIIETVLKEFPEMDKVVCRTGRPEVAVDPMAIDQSDVYVMLPSGRSKDELVTAMKEALEKEAPGAAYSFMQPIEMRMQELMEAGIRSDLAIKLYGEDLDVLRENAQKIVKVVEKVTGAAHVRAERVAGLPYLRVRVRRDAIARHGLDAQDVLNTVEAIGGKVALPTIYLWLERRRLTASGLRRNGGDDGARTSDLRPDRTEAKSAVAAIRFHLLVSLGGRSCVAQWAVCVSCQVWHSCADCVRERRSSIVPIRKSASVPSPLRRRRAWKTSDCRVAKAPGKGSRARCLPS